jgi:hypothetical protein
MYYNDYMNTNTKWLGGITETAVLLALLRTGATVSVPWGENSRYDLIIDCDGQLHRIQCRTGRLKNDRILFSTAQVYYSKEAGKIVKRARCSTIDYYGVFCPENGAVYLVPAKDIRSRVQCSLRINTDTSAIRGYNLRYLLMAKNYEVVA